MSRPEANRHAQPAAALRSIRFSLPHSIGRSLASVIQPANIANGRAFGVATLPLTPMQQSDSLEQSPNMLHSVSAVRNRVGPILVVDDYDDARACVRDALEADGYRVIEAANGQQALNYLVSHLDERVALIVLDLQMPVMDGWRFMDLVRCYVGLSKIPILVVTGVPESDLKRPAHRAVVGCIQAPYELPALVETVNHILDPDAQAGANEARPAKRPAS